MNDPVRAILKKLIAEYGIELCANRQRLEGLLRDSCEEYRKEINVLAAAIKERIVEQLLQLDGSSVDTLTFQKLVNRLCEDVGVTADLSQWAVISWAEALGKHVKVEPVHSNQSQHRQAEYQEAHQDLPQAEQILSTEEETAAAIAAPVSPAVKPQPKDSRVKGLTSWAVFILIVYRIVKGDQSWDAIATVGFVATALYLLLFVIGLVRRNGTAKGRFLLAYASFTIGVIGAVHSPKDHPSGATIYDDIGIVGLLYTLYFLIGGITAAIKRNGRAKRRLILALILFIVFFAAVEKSTSLSKAKNGHHTSALLQRTHQSQWVV